MGLDLDNYSFTADYSLGSTVSPGLSSWDYGYNDPGVDIPQTAMPDPGPAKSDSFFTDTLKTVTATAGSFLDVAGKIYQIDNQLAQTKLMQQQQKANIEIAKAETSAKTDLSKANIEAQRQIGIAQAEAAIENQKAKTQSGSAGVVIQSAANYWPIALLAGIGFLIFKSKGGAK